MTPPTEGGDRRVTDLPSAETLERMRKRKRKEPTVIRPAGGSIPIDEGHHPTEVEA